MQTVEPGYLWKVSAFVDFDLYCNRQNQRNENHFLYVITTSSGGHKELLTPVSGVEELDEPLLVQVEERVKGLVQAHLLAPLDVQHLYVDEPLEHVHQLRCRIVGQVLSVVGVRRTGETDLPLPAGLDLLRYRIRLCRTGNSEEFENDILN
ncbi:hypothetical protein CEXT_607051 [Caerostris extrusa]|uniref:Uncharacterized protein n=1 Tax=Caerostris extrusa TaxID=172846 RepID=A0AAV4PYK8_CAEEX|nr:hypothetical protein CEXT_607051 [Caerostris extrusa]